MKTIRLFVALCLFGASPCMVYAQKDAPVAGDAARLVDFLKKDYNALPPEQRQESMMQDMNTVAAVFKGYLEEGVKSTIFSKIDKSLADNVISKKMAYEMALNKKAIAQKANIDLSGFNLTKETKTRDSYTIREFDTTTPVAILKSYSDHIITLDQAIDGSKKDFNSAEYALKNKELDELKIHYSYTNTFLYAILGKFIKKYQDQMNGYDPFAAPNYSSAIPKSLPFLGGDLSFEVVMDGLARFIAKRLKEELTNSVLRDIKRELQFPDPQSPVNELKVLLPKTTEYLMQFTVDQITNFSDEIKQYIEKDLQNLLHNAVNLKTTPRFKNWISNYPDLDFAFEALEFIPQVSQLKQPLDYFTLMENSRNLSRWSHSGNQTQQDIANTFQLASLLAHSLAIVEDGQVRIAGVDFMGQYAAEPDFYQLYLGFLYQQTLKYYNGLRVGAVNFKDQLNTLVNGNIQGKFNFIKSVLTQTTASAEKVYTAALEIKRLNKSGQKIGADTLLNFVEGMISMAEDFVRAGDTLLFELNGGASLQLYKNARSYFEMARLGVGVSRDIVHKKYANALISLLSKINDHLPQNQSLKYIQTIEKLSVLEQMPRWKDWNFVYHYIFEKKIDIQFLNENAEKEHAFIVYQELNKIILYHAQLYPLSPMPTELIQFKEILFDLTTKGKNTLGRSTFGSITSYLKSQTFAELCLSYYLNTNIKNIYTAAITELTTRIPGVYNQAQINQFQTLFNQFITGIVQYKMIDDKIDLNTLRNKLIAFSGLYLASLPQTFRLSDYPLLTKLIHFVNDMALAKNSEDVEKAIEAIALPSGSYSIKRASRFNASLNSYPGLLAGNEVAYQKSAAFSTGFTAPVGLSFAWGSKKGYSNGFFIPVIDLGALVRLHFDNTSETASLPEFNFINVFSPGIYYHRGFRNSPLSLHVGGQYAPKLRRQVNDDPVESVFLGAGLTVDIPLLNFHTRPRNIRR
jgi:hypothetical protein